MTIMTSESNMNGKEKAIEIPDQSEGESLISGETPSNDEWTRPNNLNFPWPLIDLVINFKEVFQTKSNLFRHLLHSFYFQLLVWFIICILGIAFGAPTGPYNPYYNYGYRMTHIVFFVQGICGLFCIMLYICAIVLPSIQSLMAKLPYDERLVKRFLITSAHILTAFLIFWFFLGHIWFIGEIIHKNDFSGTNMYTLTLVMVPVEYVFGAWLLYCCIQNNSRALAHPGKKIQPLPDQLPDKNECLGTKETAAFMQTKI